MKKTDKKRLTNIKKSVKDELKDKSIDKPLKTQATFGDDDSKYKNPMFASLDNDQKASHKPQPSFGEEDS